jgi:hypothetical protein
MKNIFPLVLLILSACSRESVETASVVVTLPAANQFSTSSKVSTFTTDDNPDDDDLGWSTEIPDGLLGQSGVNTPINCYALMVEGPEPLMGINTCGRRKSTTREIDKSLFHFRVGRWMGAVTNAGSAPASIVMEVPTGLARKFRLIGFHATDPLIDCILLQGDADHTNLSRPYVIAESAPIDLVPGDVEVPLTMSFDNQKWFDECDFGGGSNGGSPVIATRVEIRKDSFPEGRFYKATGNLRCHAIDVQLTDNFGRPAVLPSGVSQVTYKLKDGASDLGTFDDKDSCQTNAMAIKNEFSIPAQSSRFVRRWIQIPAAHSPNFLSLSLEESAPATVGALISSTARVFPLDFDSALFYQIIAPSIGYKGESFEVDVIGRKAAFVTSMWMTSSETVFAKTSPLPASAASNFDFMPYNTNCSSNVTAITQFTNTSDTTERFCLKFSNDPRESVAFKFTSPAGQEPFFRAISRDGSEDPQRLRVVGPNQMSKHASSRCFGPIMIYLENEYGATIKNKDSDPVTLSYNFALDSAIKDSELTVPKIEFYNDANCTADLWDVGLSDIQTIPPLSHRKAFFIKVPSASVTGDRKVIFDGKRGDKTFRGVYQFSIDIPDAI